MEWESPELEKWFYRKRWVDKIFSSKSIYKEYHVKRFKKINKEREDNSACEDNMNNTAMSLNL